MYQVVYPNSTQKATFSDFWSLKIV